MMIPDSGLFFGPPFMYRPVPILDIF